MRQPFRTAADPGDLDAPHPRFSRYVALGDSQTEGVGDGDDSTGLIGLADRLAETMARTHRGCCTRTWPCAGSSPRRCARSSSRPR